MSPLGDKRNYLGEEFEDLWEKVGLPSEGISTLKRVQQCRLKSRGDLAEVSLIDLFKNGVISKEGIFIF